MSQDGTKAAGEGQPFLLIDRNLRDAADLVFDWVLNGDDLVFVGLDLVHGGIQRRRLAATRGSCNQHHAVGLRDVAPELVQVLLTESHHVERSEERRVGKEWRKRVAAR